MRGVMFAVAPGCARSEHRSAPGEDVQRGHGLGQHAGVAVGDAGDQHGELSSQRSRGVGMMET